MIFSFFFLYFWHIPLMTRLIVRKQADNINPIPQVIGTSSKLPNVLFRNPERLCKNI